MWGTDQDKREFGLLYAAWAGPTAGRNRKAAVEAMRELAGRGYAPAIFTLGDAYYQGDPFRRDAAKALDHFKVAAAAEYPSAESALGTCFLIAKPPQAVPYDPVQGAEWLRRAAEKGNAGSQYNLAFSYWTGRGVEQDPERAYFWASLAVHCSTIRTRPAEIQRDQAAAMIDSARRAALDAELTTWRQRVPLPWSEHLTYWRHLAGVGDTPPRADPG
jgi:hypothetical protein